MKKLFLFSFLITSLSSCGPGVVKVEWLKNPNVFKTAQSQFRMSTQEELLNKYPNVEEVNLYEYLPHLDSLPIEYDSFMEVYHVLETLGSKFETRYAVLKKSQNCQALIGYCEAVLIKR